MPEIKLGELLVILVVLYFIFGPGKLADFGGALGRSVRGFRTELKADDVTTTQQAVTREMARCGKCGGQVQGTDKFCPNCGTPLALRVDNGTAPAALPLDGPSSAAESRRCADCGGRLEVGDKFCMHCGRAVQAAAS